MRQKQEGVVRLGSSRTGAAKKFADWPIRMPGGKDATFIVTFEECDGALLFKATSEHPWFKDVILTRTRRHKPLPSRCIGGGARRAAGAFSPGAPAPGRSF